MQTFSAQYDIEGITLSTPRMGQPHLERGHDREPRDLAAVRDRRHPMYEVVIGGHGNASTGRRRSQGEVLWLALV